MSKEQKEQRNKNSKYDLLNAMSDIRTRYPRIRTGEIERFAPVYYPIAMVEMTLEEQTFEDFETVQLTVLRLIGMGISDYRVIAATLGLSATYVYKVMILLRGYGHITETELTDLGRESLAKEKKIVTHETLQKFQLDALNGNLLKRQEVVAGNTLNERSETIMKVGHLNYLDGVDEQMLSSQLAQNSSEAFLHQKAGVLHTNVVAIKSVRCTEIKYAKGYMLKLKGHDHPVVFAKRYNWREKELKERYPWQPMSVHDEWMITQYGFEPKTVISTSVANEYVAQLEKMMLEYCASPKMDLCEEVYNALIRFYSFREAGLQLEIGSAGGCTHAVIREEALGSYHGDLISLLRGIHTDGEYLITTQWLHGHIIRVRAEGSKIEYLCGLLSDQIDQHGRPAVVNLLKGYFVDNHSDAPLVDQMVACLRELES